MNRKRYSGTSSKEMASALSNYFPPGSKEYETVMSDWEGWIRWEPGRRRPKKAEDGNPIPQEQPEYRNRFTMKMDGEIGEIRFGKNIIFANQVRKTWNQRRHGILKSMSGYQLTI